MKKFAIGCVAVVLLAGVIGVIFVVAWFVHDKPMLDAHLSLPNKVALDAPLTMLITTSNSHPKAVTLDSIDIDDDLLEGFQVVSITPEPTDTMHILGQRSWSFGQRVKPGESLPVRFEMTAVVEGHFSGDIDVCNPNQDYHTLLGDVVVRKGEPLSSEATQDDSSGE